MENKIIKKLDSLEQNILESNQFNAQMSILQFITVLFTLMSDNSSTFINEIFTTSIISSLFFIATISPTFIFIFYMFTNDSKTETYEHFY